MWNQNAATLSWPRARAGEVLVPADQLQPALKAAYSGALKALLDLLPQYALAGKVVLPCPR